MVETLLTLNDMGLKIDHSFVRDLIPEYKRRVFFQPNKNKRKNLVRTISVELSGENEVIPSWDAKRKEVDQAVEAIDAVNKRFPELNLASNWHTVKGQWQKLKTDIAELSPQESFYRHTALIESITRFVSLIADNSNLSYDPTVESYEIGQIASANMPMSTEFLGRLRAWGGILLGQKKASGDERASIDIYAGLAQYEFAKLNLSLDKIYAMNPELKSVFNASRQEMDSKVKETGRNNCQFFACK